MDKALFKKLSNLKHAHLDENGAEVNNPKPMFHHCDMDRPLTIKEQIARCIVEHYEQNKPEPSETFEEANDFDVADYFGEDLPYSQYEINEEEMPIMQEDTLPPEQEAATAPEASTEESPPPDPEATSEQQS